jgi:hypothetical protein
VPLSKLPPVDRLSLATVTSVPEWHPVHVGFAPNPVHAWIIQHPDGAILVDTGVGWGNGAIDEWCHPHSIALTSRPFDSSRERALLVALIAGLLDGVVA